MRAAHSCGPSVPGHSRSRAWNCPPRKWHSRTISREARSRGLHVIPEAVGEAKLVRCVRGGIFDVAVDLRPNSPSFGRWTGVELTADNYLALFLPRGVAHGYLTLTDAAEVAYQFSAFHRPGIEKGIRWDDPDVAIAWPFAPTVLSDRDRNLPALADSEFAP